MFVIIPAIVIASIALSLGAAGLQIRRPYPISISTIALAIVHSIGAFAVTRGHDGTVIGALLVFCALGVMCFTEVRRKQIHPIQVCLNGVVLLVATSVGMLFRTHLGDSGVIIIIPTMVCLTVVASAVSAFAIHLTRTSAQRETEGRWW